MMEHLAGLQGVFLAVPITIFTIKQIIFGKNGGVPPASPPPVPAAVMAGAGIDGAEPSFSE
jgi:hypothetical protein